MSLFKMTSIVVISLLAAGCAANGQSAAQARPDTFVTYSCEKNKSFRARFSTETATVRIRTKDGSYELSKGERGLYRDVAEHWILALGAGNNTELVHKGKVAYGLCVADS